jgi:hypothetical protein
MRTFLVIAAAAAAAALAMSPSGVVAKDRSSVTEPRVIKQSSHVYQSPISSYAYAPRDHYASGKYAYGPPPMPGALQQSWYEYNRAYGLSIAGQ